MKGKNQNDSTDLDGLFGSDERNEKVKEIDEQIEEDEDIFKYKMEKVVKTVEQLGHSATVVDDTVVIDRIDNTVRLYFMFEEYEEKNKSGKYTLTQGRFENTSEKFEDVFSDLIDELLI